MVLEIENIFINTVVYIYNMHISYHTNHIPSDHPSRKASMVVWSWSSCMNQVWRLCWKSYTATIAATERATIAAETTPTKEPTTKIWNEASEGENLTRSQEGLGRVFPGWNCFNWLPKSMISISSTNSESFSNRICVFGLRLHSYLHVHLE